jgi:uncharacterized protein YggT (Ycf19 family)
MRVGSAFLNSLLYVLGVILDVIYWCVLIWVILSWILFFIGQSSVRWRYRKVYGVLVAVNELFTRLTYPMLRPFRRLLPPHKTAGIDWSPLLLLLAIMFIRIFLRQLFGPII